MERLTYKFPTLTLANFATNAVRKDGVGNVVNAQNGFVTVETTNAAAVKAIAESVRGYEVLREAVAAPAGLPARPISSVTARLVTHKVPMAFIKQYPSLKKKKEAAPGSKIMWSKDDNDLDVIAAKDVPSYVKDGWVIIEKFNEETMEVEVLDLTEKVKLTPDQLKKIRPGIKKDTKKEEIEEEEEEEIIVTEQFGTDGTFATARFDGENSTVPVFCVTLNHKQYAAYGAKENMGSWSLFPVMATEDKNLVISKEAIATDVSAKNLFNRLYAGLISIHENFVASNGLSEDYKATLKGVRNVKVVKPIGFAKLDVGTTYTLMYDTSYMGEPMYRLGAKGKKPSGRISGKKIAKAIEGGMMVKEEVEQVDEAKKVKYLTGPGKKDSKRIIGIYTMSGKWVKDMGTEREAANFVNKSWGEEVEQVDEAKPLVGGQKKLDVNKNGKLDAHDFKALRAKKEEVEIEEAMNNYIAFYNGKKMTVQAETSYKAQLKAIEMFKAPASKKHMVTVKLAANEEVEVNEAAPAIKAGMRLYAKQDKKTDNGSVVKGQYYKVADAGGGLFNLIHQAIGYRKAMVKVTASAIQAMIQDKIF